MKRKSIFCMTATFLVVLFVNIAFAETINILVDYTTIQAGIDASTNGDTVLVQPGTYVENINYNGKNITIGSLFLTTADTSYISQTIIDGNNNGRVVTFNNGEDETALISGLTIKNGYQNNGNGGGICCNSSSPKLENLHILNNQTNWSGGGISCNESNTIMSNIKIENNNSSVCGGGCLISYSSIEMENISVINNQAVNEGGGIFLFESSPIMEEVSLVGNSANKGGGLSFMSNSSAHLLDGLIRENIANIEGGGLYLSNSNPYLENVTIALNIANGNGGGICCRDSSNLNLTEVDILANDSGGRGGGLYIELSNPNIENTSIRFNTSLTNGGGFEASGSSFNLINSTVQGNTAGSNGGGICIFNSTPYLENVIISGNSSVDGALWIKETSIELNHVVISDNNERGINIYYYSYLELINSTIANNNEQGIYSYLHTDINVKNSIIYGNSYGIYVNDWSPGNTSITYSDIYNNQSGSCYNCSLGVGCIQTDPLFVNQISGDYHLSWTNFPISDSTKSPCIDAGDPNSPPDPDGTVADMGAYYFNQNVSIDEPEQSTEFNLTNYPNPINSNTSNLTVSFSIHKPGKVKIQLFNIKGQLVSTLLDEERNVGEHSISSTVDNLSSGIYFTNLIIDGVEKEVSKVVVLR